MKFFTVLLLLLSPVLVLGQEGAVIDDTSDRLAASHEYEEGRGYLESGDAEAALNAFTRAIALFHYDSDYYLGQAKAYSSLGRNEEALASITEAMQQEPGQVDYENTAGTICFRLKRYDEAIRFFTLALNPTADNLGDIDRASCFYNRGISYMMSGEYARAESDFGEAISRNELFVQAWHNRGIARNRLHKYDEACRDFLKAVELGNEYSFNYVKGDCK